MNSKQVLISIIIPTFNRAHLIGETLDSVLAQTYQNWECIVVDDGSTDNTDKLMAGYMAKDSRFQYHHRPTDRLAGGNAARNYGFEICNGDFIQWFDSDDLMFENYLENRINIITTLDAVDVVFCAFTYFNENGLQNRISNKFFSGNIVMDIIDGKILLGPQAYLLHSVILKDFRFDEKLKRAQDADFFFNLFTKSVNLNIIHTSEVLYMVRKHQNAISSFDDHNGSKMHSRFLVNKRILKYFFDIECSKGIRRYKTECLHDLKKLLDNKNYKMVTYNILNFEYLTLKQKAYFLFCIFTQFTFGRGANQFKNREYYLS